MVVRRFRTLVVLALIGVGAVVGGAAAEYLIRVRLVPGSAAQNISGEDLKTLMDDVARLKQLVPSQSHTMADVGDHWSNLWFAAQKNNWPLARFYFDEARHHVRWTIAIRPVRQTADGTPVDIKGIFDGLDLSAFAAVQLAIEDEDAAAFESAYKGALGACYACHVASDKPYLRPMVPTIPAQGIINWNPEAEWP